MRAIAPLAVLCLALGLSSPARADGPVVVELFTSQGCSSCPPADALLAELAEDPQIVALALHVDYWDYIGWSDRFADPAHSARQRAYAKRRGERMVYTPQMVIDGGRAVAGTKPGEVASAIREAAMRDGAVDLSAEPSGDRVRLRATARGGGRFNVHLVAVDPGRTVAILEGENAGHTLDYANIVTDWQTVGGWDGAEPLDVVIDAPEPPYAVLVQEPGPGRIVAARMVR